MMKRPKGAAVSGEIRVREEEKSEGNKRGEASKTQRTSLVESTPASHRSVPCCNQFRAAANKPTARLSSDIGTLCSILPAFRSILNENDE